jgi:dihydrodipicolinate synthase/N-acetylneuraminate lyase
MSSVATQRTSLVELLFPQGIPRLWCPLLTHYNGDGTLDTVRIAAHIRHMRPWVSAFLAPGSTGDGWEMTPEESDTLLAFLVEEAKRQDFSLMPGVLRTEPGTVVPAIRQILERFTGGASDPAALAERKIVGFTVTPPKGADLEQGFIHRELEAMAQSGVPLAIYQLPQITENEMSPETIASLVATYPNVYLMKDTSGLDHVVLSGVELSNLYLVRGAEGDYARWIKNNGGSYDGFLLSTANSFAAELGQMINLLLEGRIAEANALSGRVSRVVTAVFTEAGKLPYGNPFANANKAIDHHYAWGSDADKHAPPMTHSGNRLPESLLALARDHLAREGLTTDTGYML